MLSLPQTKSPSDKHPLDGETVVIDYAIYMPKGAASRKRWQAHAIAPDGMKVEFWMYQEHADMLREAGFMRLDKRVGEQHLPPDCCVVLTWSQKLGLRMDSVLTSAVAASGD